MASKPAKETKAQRDKRLSGKQARELFYSESKRRGGRGSSGGRGRLIR